jgi:hypothetical protein
MSLSMSSRGSDCMALESGEGVGRIDRVFAERFPPKDMVVRCRTSRVQHFRLIWR